MTTLISFYTNDWKYPIFAEELAFDCKNLEIPYIIEELPSTGSYLKNTCMKPKFILDKLLQLKSPVLWVDCDGCVLGRPIFSNIFDFAAKKRPLEHTRQWHVGTLWFNYTEASINYLKKWIENTGNISDDSSMERTWREIGHTVNAYDLPKEYFVILKRGEKPYGVICHRISDGIVKKREMPIALKKAKEGLL